MSNEKAVQETAEFIKEKFLHESTGHDWWHMYRVWQLAKHIASQEKGANLLVVELGALLHDIADFKLHDGDEDIGPREARKWLEGLKLNEKTISDVEYIVRSISFKGAKVAQELNTHESRVVYDADKLDAMGAIGIARTFAFGGAHGRVLHDPNITPLLHESFDEYKTSTPPTVNHFYEKLLLLKDRMQTKTGKVLAEQRHQYMENFLQEFYKEWDGEA